MGEGLFGKVHVIKNVILAKTVVSGAAGAIAELQVGVFGIGPTAYGAFVTVPLFLDLSRLLLGCSLELDGLVGILVLHPPPTGLDPIH